MKPRLRLSRRLWLCFTPGYRCVGYGYTPEQAYAEWWDELRSRWVREQDTSAR